MGTQTGMSQTTPTADPAAVAGNGADASGSVLPTATSGAMMSGQVFQSEMQLLFSLPGSATQMWHSDNAHGGITVIIPLVDVTIALGPTQLMPGTQHLSRIGETSRRGPMAWLQDLYTALHTVKENGIIPDSQSSKGEILIPAGSAVIFD